MEKFTIPYAAGSERRSFELYIGEASTRRNPLYYQILWLKEKRQGEISPEVMESFQKLRDIAFENGVSFEELCVYALKSFEPKKDPE